MGEEEDGETVGFDGDAEELEEEGDKDEQEEDSDEQIVEQSGQTVAEELLTFLLGMIRLPN